MWFFCRRHRCCGVQLLSTILSLNVETTEAYNGIIVYTWTSPLDTRLRLRGFVNWHLRVPVSMVVEVVSGGSGGSGGGGIGQLIV